MKYFRMHQDYNEKVVGIYPQSTDCYLGDIQNREVFQNSRIESDFDLPIPKLRNKAKPTSLLSVVAIPPRFLIADSALMELLVRFSEDSIQFWKIKVAYKNNYLERYNLLYITSSHQEEIIDFSKSEFYEGDLKNWRYKGDKIEINSMDQWIEIKESLKSERKVIKHNQITLNLSGLQSDLVRVRCQYFLDGYIVSEQLKAEIEEARLTGIIFKDIEDYDKRIVVTY